jgi:tetratricopeptide (TPR) repeat protein
MEKMDPIGTITSYFPYIDSDTKDVLEKLMTDSSDYNDFAIRLVELVLKDESPVMVVYFAIHHASRTYNHRLIEGIRERYSEHQVLGPNLYLASAFQGKVEDLAKVHEMADAVLETNPPEWLALEMKLIKFKADMANYPKTMYDQTNMENILETIHGNPDFGHYEAIVNDFLAIRAQIDGDGDERLRCVNRALRITEKFDDKVRLAHFIARKANIIMNRDRDECRALLEEAFKIVDKWLGMPVDYAGIIDKRAIINALRGEFDKAIELQLQVVTYIERAGLRTGNASYYLATFYNVIDEPESGLEWALMAEEQFKTRPFLINRAVMQQVWSLHLLDRHSEAQLLLDSSRESILKSGDENQLAWFKFASGLLELEQGNLMEAKDSIKEAVEIYRGMGTGLLMELIFLFQLAKIEVETYTEDDTLFPALERLEEMALAEKLPGFLAQVLLLRARIAMMKGDDAILRETILQLQILFEDEGLDFLRPQYERIQRIL